jgi:hypothetical protein
MLMNALFKLTLKSSAIGALAFFAAAAGCSSSSDDDNPGAGGDSSTTGGTNSDAGKSSTAGTSHSGGDNSGTGGAKNGTAGEGGAGKGGAPDVESVGGSPDIEFGGGGDSAGGAGGAGTGTGPAVAKFCNTLTYQGASTTMILEVGEGAEKVTFTAAYGECVPADGDACEEIPLGKEVLVQMFDADDPSTALDFGSVKVKEGQDWIFYTEVENDQPVWNAGTLKAGSGVSCEDVVWDDI